MDVAQRTEIVEQLARAFGGAEDVTPGDGQPLHVLLPNLELPDPWQPSPMRALVVFGSWPGERPLFYVAESVVGETGQPPQSNHSAYLLGESWRDFSFAFPWSGNDPVRAIQLWMNRFLDRD
jgi:hypothetical protein